MNLKLEHYQGLCNYKKSAKYQGEIMSVLGVMMYFNFGGAFKGGFLAQLRIKHNSFPNEYFILKF
ncbi:MAG: hypothetical protein Crog4KO_36680 [Crocinitomicaceae bacterium]